MSSTHHNIIANYAGRAWSFLSAFIFVPFYLRFLGSEAYGIVGFYTVVLGFLAFADAGLTATLNREFARSDRTLSYKANLLVTVEIIYFSIFFIIIICFWFFAPIIASRWLSSGSISSHDIVFFVRLIGIGVAFQLISSLYQGGLMGLQKQVLANSMLIGYGVIRSGVILIPLYFFPVLTTYFSWQIGITIIYFLLLRLIVKKEVQSETKAAFSKLILADIWHFAAGMFALSILSSILIQADKLVVSNLFSLSEFGFYTLASTFSQIPLMLVTPIGLAILPKFTQNISIGNHVDVIKLFRKTTFLVVAVASFIAFFLAAYAPDILLLWTHNIDVMNNVSQVARILCLGTLFQAVQLIVYYLAIANGYTKINILLGVFSVIFFVPALYISISYLGILGAGIPWLIMSLITFLVLGYIVIKKFTNHAYKTWLLSDTLVPFFTALLIVTVIYLLTYKMLKGWFIIGYGFIASIIWLLISVWQFGRRFPDDQMLIKLKRIFIRSKKDYNVG